MHDYFFFREPGVAPAPPEYADFAVRRALWQSVGARPEEMSARDYYAAVTFLGAEAEDEDRRRKAVQ